MAADLHIQGLYGKTRKRAARRARFFSGSALFSAPSFSSPRTTGESRSSVRTRVFSCPPIEAAGQESLLVWSERYSRQRTLRTQYGEQRREPAVALCHGGTRRPRLWDRMG
jgi:hypothetical protein